MAKVKKNYKRKQARRDSLEQVRRDSLERVRLDSIKQDSIRRNHVTPDLALFELKGPVKSVNKGYIAGYACSGATFDYDGKVSSLHKLYYNNLRGKIKRDSQGRIKRISMLEEPGWPVESSDNITYDENNRPIKNKCNGMEGGGMSHYSYNDAGLLISESIDYDGEGDAQYLTTYTYLEYDIFDNWIKRKAAKRIAGVGTINETQTRKITYYEKSNNN